MGFECLALFCLQLRGVCQQAVEAAELCYQIGRALLANAGHTGDVVTGVANERQHVDHLRRLHAELFENAALIEPRAILARVVDADRSVADELEEVLVDRDDRDVMTGCGCACGDRADHIISLVARAP